MTYRAEIDGLRAFAVLAVVLYHFGLPYLDGGFVGVDIFFVISGFLIGGILWAEQQGTGRISLTRFYLRRFRRLAPAFFAMAAVTAIFAWLVLLPFEYRAFGKSLIAATLYLANVLFFREAGYFDSGAGDKVLLHMWSLSVEEQFYVFLPLALILLGRWPHLLRAALWAVFALSLLACVAFTPAAPTAAFYLFPFRAWEMLAGVLLAIYGQTRGATWAIHASLSWLGLALLAGAVILVRPGASFPGYQVIAPALGTLLVLANGQHYNAINRALSASVPVFIGLVSYSLYLWHWPVLTLSRYYRDGYSGPLEASLWLALASVLAVLSWRYVERPVRHAKALTFPKVLGAVTLASLIAVACGGYAYLTNGAPDRFRPEARVHIAASGDFLQDWSHCALATAGPLQGINICTIGPENQSPEVLVWGDSHARAYMNGLAAAASEFATPGLLIWTAGCPPLFGITKQESAATPAEDRTCSKINTRLRAAIPQLASIKRVLLIGRWNYYATGQGIGLDAQNHISLAAAGSNAPQAEIFSNHLRATVTELQHAGKQVSLLRQLPEVPEYDSRIVARKLAHGTLTPELRNRFATPRRNAEARGQIADTALQAQDSVTVIDPWPILCTATECSVMYHGQPIYFDNNHLTNSGAMTLRSLFMPFLAGAPK